MWIICAKLQETMKKYPPYVNAYGKISELFKEIKRASVPTKFTYDFIHTSLGLKSSSYRAMIPLLKRLGLLDTGNVPTQAYKDFRDDSLSGAILAQKLKDAYSDLFAANEFAHKLNKKDLTAKLKTVLGASDNDPNLTNVAGTFTELVKLADFEARGERKIEKPDQDEKRTLQLPPVRGETKFGISYTINLNLPATTEIEVFNAIFKSLRENILGDNE